MHKGRRSSSKACSGSLLNGSSHQALSRLIVFLATLPLVIHETFRLDAYRIHTHATTSAPAYINGSELLHLASDLEGNSRQIIGDAPHARALVELLRLSLALVRPQEVALSPLKLDHDRQDVRLGERVP
jgi:hypothetical protein